MSQPTLPHRLAVLTAALPLCFAMHVVPPASAATLASLVETDELGYECLPEDLLEAAFAVEGKPAILPQTCLPAPCERQLSQADLAVLIGHDPDRSRYDEYVGRYGDVCVDETQVAWDDPEITPEVFASSSSSPTPTVVADPDTPQRTVLRTDRRRFFDLPPSSKPPASQATPKISTRLPPFPNFRQSVSSFDTESTDTTTDLLAPPDLLVNPPSEPSDIPTTTTSGVEPIPPSDTPDMETPVPVPLPGAAWLLFAAIGALCATRRRP